jgi:hypothetical protein
MFHLAQNASGAHEVPYINWYQELNSQEQSRRIVKLTSHLHLVSMPMREVLISFYIYDIISKSLGKKTNVSILIFGWD